MTDPKQLSEESKFRAALQDVVMIADHLVSYTESVQQLADMVRLALANEGQLRLLMDLVTQKK